MSYPYSAVTWEVRPTAGNDTNGGGFAPGASGTDFSQQNSKNSVGNNISTTDAVASGTTTLVSASASFTSAIVGNLIYLSGSGVTTDWYVVSAYTNSTTVTIDRSPGTGTGLTMNIGGAFATPAGAFAAANGIATVYGSSVANIAYIRGSAGSYVATAVMTLINQWQIPFQFIGYTSTRGDNGQATWTTATNSTFLLQAGGSNPAGFVFTNINFTTTASTKVACIDGSLSSYMANLRFVNCVFNGFTTSINGWFDGGVHYQISNVIFESCIIENCTADGADVASETFFFDCTIRNNAGIGVNFINNGGLDDGGVASCDRCVFYNNGAQGAYVNGGATLNQYLIPVFTNCDFVSNVSHGLDTSGIANGCIQMVRNCTFVSNGGYGWNGRATQYGPYSVYANAYYNNASGQQTPSVLASATDITLTGSPYTNPSGGDFSLNSTSGAGAACKDAGYQGFQLGQSDSGEGFDIGAVQTESSGGGGGGGTNIIISKNVTQVFVEDY